MDEEPTSSGQSSNGLCRCGYDKSHHMVSPDGEYTFWGYVFLTFGISAVPTRINYRCRICQQVVDTTTDPATLRGGIR